MYNLLQMKKTRNKLPSLPRFKGVKYVSDNLQIFEMSKIKIDENKPIYILVNQL